jgi:hypothetical protein
MEFDKAELTLHCLTHDRELWAVSKCGGVKVFIYKNVDKRMCKYYNGNSMWRRGVMHVDIAAWLFEPKNKKCFDRVLRHEFVHVVEYCNSPEFLSPKITADNCTLLAQAMDDGLGDLYENLKETRHEPRCVKA